MKVHTRIDNISKDLLSSCNDEFLDTIFYYTEFEQGESESDDDFEEAIRKAVPKILAEVLEQMATKARMEAEKDE